MISHEITKPLSALDAPEAEYWRAVAAGQGGSWINQVPSDMWNATMGQITADMAAGKHYQDIQTVVSIVDNDTLKIVVSAVPVP